jgi:hypothetical protein
MKASAQKQNQPQPQLSSNITMSSAEPLAAGRVAHPLRHLQRPIGNQAVARLLRAQVESPAAGFDASPTTRFAHDFNRIQVSFRAPIKLQAKLKVNTPGDIHEQEADRISEQVTNMTEPQLQRVCACGGGCPACRKEQAARETVQTKNVPANDIGEVEAPAIVHEVLRSSGAPLDPATREFFEPRFSHNFSHVRVHTDARAAQSSQAIQALAYTAGNNIVFNTGQYSPRTNSGKLLLAHELTHVVQQGEGRQANRIARFADNDHNIIEEVALTLANLSPAEIEQVHAGNTKRDYSQSPAQLNLVLLCDANKYGGYKDYEHFDNFKWDEALQNWRSRGNPEAFGKKNPINHIEEELTNFVDALPDKAAFQHVGNAFHAIEDFFAHSNFIELINDDFRFGHQLITGSVEGNDDTSILKILESISGQETAPLYGQQGNKAIADAPLTSHPRMAKDYKSNTYHTEAMVLAALVIQDLGADLNAIKALTVKEERIKHVREVIMTKVKRFLRPPDKQDKWWEALRASGGKTTEKAIKETTARTPVTTNQCILSPLRSIEASRDSNFKLLGPAFPVPTKYGHVWVQVGTGFAAPPAFSGPSRAVEPRSMEFLKFGVQVTGRF